MKTLNTFRFKITALSPVHIGSGEVYEPTNFVIDEGKLYEFDETLFYKAMNQMDRNSFHAKLGDWMQIIGFYKEHKDLAKTIANFSCDVSKKVEQKYNTLINKDNSENKNQFVIQKVFKNPNTSRAVIPGSSIKGMLETAFGIYENKEKKNAKRQELIVSDARLLKGNTEIGFSYRKHKNPDKEARSSIPAIVEVIKKETSFLVSISTTKTFEEIRKSLQKYHEQRSDSKFSSTQESFVARIGKFSGKPYMVDDGRNVKNSFGKPVVTHTLFENDEAFGWIEFSLLTEETFKQYQDEIEQEEKKYYEERQERQKEIKESILKSKREREEILLKKQQLKEAEEKEREEEKGRRALALSQMDPLDKLIDSYDNDVAKVINAMKDGSIENFEEIKSDLATKLKEIMMKNSRTWEKAKKKALDRKEYIQNILDE